MANTMDKLAKELKSQMNASDARKPKPYDAQAEVLRVEDGVAWVHIPGGVEETPVRLTINAKKGDMVNIRVANGTAWITGNSTNPPTDDSTANYAVDISNEVKQDVTILNTVVAEEIEATNARFGNVEADTAKIHNLTADQLTATVGYIDDLTADNITANDISADHATIDNLDANYAQINAANITDLSAQNAWVNKIMVQTGLIAHESNIFTLDAIQVNAANITAGTIDVNRLIVTVDGQKYLVNVNPSTGTPTYEKLDGNIVEPRTITADKIVAHDITVQEITTENLVGTNGWINLNQGKFFYTTNGSTWANTTNGIMWDGTSLKIKGDVNITSGNVYTKTETDAEINKIEVGGRNYVKDSQDIPLRNKATGNSDYYTLTVYHNDTAFEIGDVLTASTNVEVLEGSVSRIVFYLYGKSTETNRPKSLTVAADIVNGKAVAQLTLNNNYGGNGNKNFNLLIYQGINGQTAGNHIKLTNVKLEKGNKATDWTPAPEDVEAYTDTQVSGKADKSDAVARQQRIYYRNTTSGAPSKNTTWLTTSGTGYGNWSLKIPQMTSGTTKYPYLYTAVQTQTVSQLDGTTCSCSDVLLDDTTTVIDGGTIITGTVNANAVNASSGTFDTANIPNLNASKITAGDISADRMKVNSISAINSNTGTVQIAASKVDIAGAAVFNNYSTTTEMNTAIGNAVDNIDVGGRNLLRRSDYSVYYGDNYYYRNGSTGVVFASDRVTIPFGNEVYLYPYTKQRINNVIPSGTTVICSMDVYEQTITSGNHRVYVSPLRSDNTVNWSNIHNIAANDTGKHVWTFTTTEDTYGFVIDFDTRNSTSGGMTIGRVKVEIGNKATDWTPAPEDAQDYTDNAVNSIEVGGRNILKNSDTSKLFLWSTAQANGGTMTIEENVTVSEWGTNEARRVYGKAGSTNNLFGIINGIYAPTQLSISGQPYVFSIYIKNQSANAVSVNLNGVGTGVTVASGEITRVISTNAKGNGVNNIQFTFAAPSASANYDFVYWHPQIEYGTKATDWSPAPEDVQAEIDAKKSTHTLSTSYSYTYANILTYSAEGYGGTAGANWTVSSTSGVKVGDTARLKVTVSDMSNAPVYIIGTVTAVTSGTVLKMTSHGLDTTVIDGGNILTNSIGANQIKANSIGSMHMTISDSTNLATVNEKYEASLPTDFSDAYKAAISDGYLIKKVATQQYLMLTDFTPNSFKQNDEFYYEFYGKAATAGGVTLNLYCYTGTPPTHTYSAGNGTGAINLTTTEALYSGTIKLSNAGWNNATTYLIGFNDARSTKSQIYIKKCIVRRKNAGELIVDGAITADKLAANSVVVGKMNADTQSKVLNSNVEIGGRNLVLNTASMPVSGTNGWRASGGTVTHIDITNPPISGITGGVRVTNSGTSAARIGLAQDNRYNTFVAGEKYSQGFWIRASSSFTSTVDCQPVWIASGTTGVISTSMTLTTSWQYVKGEGATLNGTQSDYYSAGYAYASNVPAGGYIEICANKVEKGTKATDWTPAIEDDVGTNLLSYPYLRDFFSGSPYTGSGVTFTLNKDGTVTAKGTATANAWYQLTSSSYPNNPNGAFCLPAGRYTISGCPSGGASATYRLQLVAYELDGSASFASAVDYGRGATINMTKAGLMRFEIGIMNGHACPSAGYTFKPMLEAGSVIHSFVSPTSTEAAAQSATKYITRIDDGGIFISPSNQSPTTSATGNSVKLNATGLEIYKGGNSVAFYGDTARIGKSGASHVDIASDSISMSDGVKEVFLVEQKTMYVRTERNYKGRQFTNSTDRHVDSWNTGATPSTWDSITVTYRLNNTSKSKKITSISNGVIANDEIYVHFNYSNGTITLTYGRGSSAASSAVLKLDTAVLYYVTDEQLSQFMTGTYPDTTLSGALRVGGGTSNSNKRNIMLLEWGGNAKFRGDISAFCSASSSGGLSLTKTEENLEICVQSDSKGTVTIDSYRVGRMVVLRIHMELAGTTAAGQRINTVSLSGKHLPKPLGNSASGASYYGTHSIGLFLNYNSSASRYELAIHNASSTSFTPVSGYDLYGTLTYICGMDSLGNIEYVDD